MEFSEDQPEKIQKMFSVESVVFDLYLVSLFGSKFRLYWLLVKHCIYKEKEEDQCGLKFCR